MLLISQPSTPGLTELPETRRETRTLISMMKRQHVESLLLEDDAATIGRVTGEMKTYDWVHFACHAIQDREHSLASGIHLHDGRLELLEMMKSQISNADHAFMSACETSTGDKTLSDEAVHTAAGFLATGPRRCSNDVVHQGYARARDRVRILQVFVRRTNREGG